MEIDYGTSKEVKIKRMGSQVCYMPFYTNDDKYWLNGIGWQTEQEAIDSVKYDETIIRLRIVKIELPVLNINEDIEIGS